VIPQYIAFEGIDRSGKDTQIALLARRLERQGVTPIILHEPSYGTYGRRIRATLKSITEDIGEQRALFAADRIDHVATKIAPALSFVRANPSFVILQSRSILSAAAYQPRGDGDEGLRATIEAELRIAPMPDAIVVLDLQWRLRWTESAAREFQARWSGMTSFPLLGTAIADYPALCQPAG
jgi:dTMP kinase